MDKSQDKHIKLDNSEVVIAGMSLRDYFSAAALTGLISLQGTLDSDKRGFSDAAYRYADAMMEARKKVPTSC